ncbi:MFS transporter [Microbacterium yannicii]|uniref:MFS transporter n=1 Tax=Microbacterium yannicii TaxID=671622 RepID=UPI0002F70E64|nr:MFS transporter [Microbacterium yannicii]
MRPRSFSRGVALLAATALFMENLDATIIQTAAPAIAQDLGVAPVDVGATIVAYLLAVGVCIPASAWLAGRFGIRRIFLASIAVFTIASALCAVAPTLELLTAARVLQGVGGALMVPVGRYAVLRATGPEDLLEAVAYLTWPALIAPVVAPALGGLISDTIGWPWIFLLNIPLGIAALVAGWVLLKDGGADRAGRFDVVGFVLVAGALAAVTLGAEVMSRGDLFAFVLGGGLAVAGLVLGAVAVRSMKRGEPPLLDLSALRLLTFRAGNVSGTVYRLMITAAPFLFTLQFQVSFGWSAFLAGIAVIAVFAGNLGIKPLTTPIIRLLGFRTTLIVSNALGLALLAVCASFTAATPFALITTVLFFSGVFRSLGFSAYGTLQFADIAPEDMNNANTLSSTLQQAGAAIGIVVATLLVRVGTDATERILGDAASGYSWAYVMAAAVMVVPLTGAILLPRDAGHRATRRAVRL